MSTSKGEKALTGIAIGVGVILIIGVIIVTMCVIGQTGNDFEIATTEPSTTSATRFRVVNIKGVDELISLDELDHLINDGNPFALLVYSNECGHCKAMLPNFARASHACEGVRFAQIEASVLHSNASTNAL